MASVSSNQPWWKRVKRVTDWGTAPTHAQRLAAIGLRGGPDVQVPPVRASEAAKTIAAQAGASFFDTMFKGTQKQMLEQARKIGLGLENEYDQLLERFQDARTSVDACKKTKASLRSVVEYVESHELGECERELDQLLQQQRETLQTVNNCEQALKETFKSEKRQRQVDSLLSGLTRTLRSTLPTPVHEEIFSNE